ncbi:recombinase family protein [Pseudogemmatithrix spongiicola]|uniref:Recombinase family protein n=1 Tax=Pseudogemmatithrix spongiicola TaxID=3062599 RepID=A0AA49JYW2_9BACT|nr:recombinase family protein [Gemmatimonadaceae bacterium 'strain 138']WKW14148.1 recombinase family protein [Gemmatimonadaceae bacterium 'strain 318']
MRKATSRDFQPSTAAALFLRVSTEEQAREGVSLDAQEARLLGDAAAHGLDVNVTYRDSGVSGSVPLGERPQGAELPTALDRGELQRVLAFKLDRLFRDAVDCLRTVRQWDDAGTAMHLVDLGAQAVNAGSAVGRFFLGMLAGVAAGRGGAGRAGGSAALWLCGHGGRRGLGAGAGGAGSASSHSLTE